MDDFGDGDYVGWSVCQGSWDASSGVLHGEDAFGFAPIFTDQSFPSDRVVSSRLRTETNGSGEYNVAVLVLNWVDNDNQIDARIFTDGTVELIMWLNNAQAASATVSSGLSTFDWHTFVAVCAGSNIKLYIDGVLYIDDTDSNYDDIAGSVGYQTCASAWFDDLSVSCGGFGAWFDDGWSFRKSVCVKAADGAGVGYQVRVNVHYLNGSVSGADVFLGGKCKGGFGDVRFTAQDGVSLLPFWMETPVSDNATFWVRVSANLSSSATLMYLYYGNSAANSTSNGAATFDFFDDFTTDTSWDLTDATVNCGYLNLQPDVYQAYAEKTRPSGYNDYRFRFRAATASNAGCWQAYSRKTGSIYSTLPRLLVGFYEFTSLSDTSYWTQGNVVLPTINPARDDSGHIIQVLKSGENYTDTWDDMLSSSDLDSTPENGTKITFCGMELSAALQVDWVFLAKYVSSEPALGRWGIEEGTGPAAPSRSAVLFFGSQDYYEADATKLGGFSEKWVSEGISNWSRNLFADTGKYGFCADYWGFDTQPSQIYDALGYCDDNYDYIAVFYKGHSKNVTCYDPSCPHNYANTTVIGTHFSVYDSEGWLYSQHEYIEDYRVHERLDSDKVRFAFMWTCGSAWDNATGELYGDHSYAWPASLMGKTNLSTDAYHNNPADYSGYCYMGFANFSIWYTNITGHVDGYNYGHFLYEFFYSALQTTNTSIREALNLATSAVISPGSDFDETDLYGGYDMIDPRYGNNVRCYLRVWGDGGIVLPH